MQNRTTLLPASCVFLQYIYAKKFGGTCPGWHSSEFFFKCTDTRANEIMSVPCLPTKKKDINAECVKDIRRFVGLEEVIKLVV